VLSLQTDFTHDDVAVDGHFTSGVKLLNQIHALIDRAILRNLASVITDCPTREKLGWLEQTHLAGYSIMDNYGVLKLYEKVADDMGEAQLSDGFVPGIAPEYVAFVDAKGDSTNFRDSPEWGSASILAPWQAYQFYGDLEGVEGSLASQDSGRFPRHRGSSLGSGRDIYEWRCHPAGFSQG
jgi:hypothetical protein